MIKMFHSLSVTVCLCKKHNFLSLMASKNGPQDVLTYQTWWFGSKGIASTKFSLDAPCLRLKPSSEGVTGSFQLSYFTVFLSPLTV